MEKNKNYPYSMENNTQSSRSEDTEVSDCALPCIEPRLIALWDRHAMVLETKRHIGQRVSNVISELIEAHPGEEDILMKAIQGQYEILLKQRDEK